MDGRTDEELLERFTRQGDRDAFVHLVNRHIGGIRRLLFVLFAGHREDMEDAEQEALLAIYRGLHRFSGRARLGTYLLSLCRNRAVDILRSKQRRRRMMRRVISSRPPPTPGPEEQAVERETRREALGLLLELDEDSRTVLLLVDVEGLPIREAAAALNRPPGTVKSRLHRAREKLAAAWRRRDRQGETQGGTRT